MLIYKRASQAASKPAEPEGSYLASATDLMIGILFVFILLVVVLALKQHESAKPEIAKPTVNTPSVTPNNEPRDPRGRIMGQIGNALEKALEGGNVEVDENGRLSLPERYLFQRGDRELSPEVQIRLGSAATSIYDFLKCYVSSEREYPIRCDENTAGDTIDTIFIEGHTDSTPYAGTGYDNWNLSNDRARSVYNVLMADPNLQKLRNKAGQSLFSISAYADTRPLNTFNPSRNRRVDLKVVMEYQGVK